MRPPTVAEGIGVLRSAGNDFASFDEAATGFAAGAAARAGAGPGGYPAADLAELLTR